MMKKKILVLLTALLLFCFAVPAFADEVTAQRVFDYADLLSEEDEREMHLWIADMQENWDMDLAFLTTYDTEGLSVQEYGAQFYMDHDLGMGETYDGVIFVLDMGTREGQIITSGKAIDIYTDYYIDVMWDNMVGHLSDGEYYWAFYSLYMDMHELAGEYELYLTDPGYVSDYEKEKKGNKTFLFLGIALVASLAIAAVRVSTKKSECRNVKPYTDGRAYLKENGVYYTVNRDTFANTHTAVIPIPKDNSKSGGSWGGGSSTFSSGGRSFGGGGGKF